MAAVKESQIRKLVGSDIHLVRVDGREFTGELTTGSKVSESGESEFVIQVGTRGRPPFFFASEVQSIAAASVAEVNKARKARASAPVTSKPPVKATASKPSKGNKPSKAEVQRAFVAADRAMANLASIVERVTA